MAKLCIENGIDGEDRGSTIGVNGMAGEKRGFFQIIFTNESENAVVEVKAITRESRDMLREFGGIRVLWGLRFRRLRLRASSRGGRERRFDAEAALPTASFGSSFLRRSKREKTKGDEGRSRCMVPEQMVGSG